MDERMERLLRLLSGTDFISAAELSARLKISEKTVRMLTAELSGLLKAHGASIERRYGKGMRVHTEDPAAFSAFLKEAGTCRIPGTSQQRIQYLAVRFLTAEDYLKVDGLCGELFVSRKTMSAELKGVRDYIGGFRLELETRPRYGVRVRGREFDIRQCLGSMPDMAGWPALGEPGLKDTDGIHACLIEGMAQYGYTVYESEMPDLVFQVQIQLNRFRTGRMIEMYETDENSVLQERDILTAQACARLLQERFGLALPAAEIKYLAILLGGKKQTVSTGGKNQVIDMEINRLVSDMLDRVEQVLNVDMRSDFNLHMSLCQHMISMRIRLGYRLKLNNPMLKEIREVYSFPYEVAVQAAFVLSEYFRCPVSEDEIGYLALCFALALERRKKKSRRSIILVCASGEGSAKLFEYRFRQIFGEYLSSVYTCDLNTLKTMDFSQADYVFSTVPIEFHVPVPIYQVQYFFDRYNYQELKQILTKGRGNSIRDYFFEELFFTDIEGKTREAVLEEMCRRIGEKRRVPENFLDCVLRRERLMQTDFCGRIAIPHPYSPVTEDTFVCTAVLKKPVRWYAHEVQVVFLLSVSVNKENLENFYESAPQFMMNEAYMEALVEQPSFDTLTDLIRMFEENGEHIREE